MRPDLRLAVAEHSSERMGRPIGRGDAPVREALVQTVEPRHLKLRQHPVSLGHPQQEPPLTDDARAHALPAVFGGVVGNITSLVSQLGNAGLAGLISLGVVLWLFQR